MKKFREKMSERAGFTLVELIVVIAILGILAGAAVAGYSGYITKANAASDTQILSAVKTAADAAEARYGTVTDITVTLSADKKVSKVFVKTSTETSGHVLFGDGKATTGDTGAAASDFCDYYFKGNENLVFKGENAGNGATVTFENGKWGAIAPAPSNNNNDTNP